MTPTDAVSVLKTMAVTGIVCLLVAVVLPAVWPLLALVLGVVLGIAAIMMVPLALLLRSWAPLLAVIPLGAVSMWIFPF